MPRGLVSGVMVGFVNAPESTPGLIVPEPSVTPSPFAVWAEYIAADADGAIQRREARQVVCLPQCLKVSLCFSAFAPRSAGVKVQLDMR